MQVRLTTPPKSSQDAVELREFEGDPDAARIIREYLALADVALGTGEEPSPDERESREATPGFHRKRVA